MTDDLTTADRFELVDAQHYNPVQSEYEDATEHVSIDRWTKYGKDRLYLNGLATGDGWVSLKDGSSGGDRWTKCKAGYELDGDELTINVGRKSHRPTYVITVRVHGDAFEPAEDGDAEDEPELVCDGGEDAATHVTDAEVQDAIEQHDDPDHPDATATNEARDILAAIQRSVEAYWAEHMDAIEDGSVEVVHEDADLIVLADHTGHGLREELDAVGVEDDVTRQVVRSVYHRSASRLCDYSWSASDPLVVRKPAGMDGGQRYVEAVINGLCRRDLSPGQAWSYYGTVIRGSSRNSWAVRMGYSDHSAVSEAVRKAEAKLP